MEIELTKEVITALKDRKRPELIDCPIYGQYDSEKRTFIYDDAHQRYILQNTIPQQKTVRSVKAFIAIIKEELKRRSNETGNKATVKVNLDGGYFIPDDNFGRECIEFTRLNSQQWNLLKSGINKVYNHKGFLQFLQGLSPSINDFRELFKRFSLLRLVGKSTLTSNPIITEDGQTQGYTCTYKLDVPFAKAGEKNYTIPIELLFFRNEDDELRIEVQCPLFENIEEQAIIDEAELVKSETNSYSELLVLSDF